jgi:N-carbamoylputrescine amidase
VPEPIVVKATGTRADSPARVDPPRRTPFRIGVVQERWHANPEEHAGALLRGIEIAAGEGARLVCLQELTLSRYFATDIDAHEKPEAIPGGRTTQFAKHAARKFGVFVQASLYQRAEDGGLGYNTAIVVGPDGDVVARVHKVHIPGGAGYHEDRYFRPADDSEKFPIIGLDEARFGFPTCWDQWFPEVARTYAVKDADVIVYPTAIGSEPDHPDFDTEPLWEKVITANGIANGTFMVAVNRIGFEAPLTFYGSSFISDPYGRVLVQAPRDQPAVLVADLDLDQRRDWLDLFPILQNRRPEAYGALVGELLKPK